MRHLRKPFAILALNTNDIIKEHKILNECGLKFHQVWGKYNGKEETAYAIDVSEDGTPQENELLKKAVKQLAIWHLQESILFVRNDNSCYLWFRDGRVDKELGNWREVDELTATRENGYTLDPTTHRYYVTSR